MISPRPSRLITLRNTLLAGLAAMFLASPVLAQVDRTPDFGTTFPGDWTVDRYLPDTYELMDGVFGRDDVIHYWIDNDARPSSYSSSFYATQGLQYQIDGLGTGSPAYQVLTADVYIPESWASADNGKRRTGMWSKVSPLGSDADGDSRYPILGFTNADGTGVWRYWSESGWNVLGNPVVYGAWNTLRIEYATNTYSAYVNGAFGISEVGPTANTRLHRMFIQAYQFDDLADEGYDVYWSNTATDVVPEPASMLLLATGLLGLGAAFRRKRDEEDEG